MLNAPASVSSSSPLIPDTGDTILEALDLGALTAGMTIEQVARVGDSPAAGADVDWYTFTLSESMRLDVSATTGVLSLYHADPFNFNDPLNWLGHRLLTQATGDGEPVQLVQDLAPGTYHLAVSGTDNFYFHPLIAGSGYAGGVGDYRLSLSASALSLPSGPALLESNPEDESVLDSSPLTFRLIFSAPLDASSIVLDTNVGLLFSPTGTFGDGNDQLISLSWFNFSTTTNELQLLPSMPLGPGAYRLALLGDTQGAGHPLFPGAPVDVSPVLDVNGVALSQDFSLEFTIAGIEGNVSADDTVATAHHLGDLTHGEMVQVIGAIGDDATDPVPFNVGDVDLYRFTVQGDGQYAFTAEVFAHRLGGSLNAAATLFRLDPTTGTLIFVASNDNTANNTPTADNSGVPLFADPALFAGLTAGEYYLAVTSSGNMPNPEMGLLSGVDGIFDPTISHSGAAGSGVGDYVLNLALTPDNEAPEVVAVTPGPDTVLDAPPTTFVVRFSEAVNLRDLAFRAFEQTSSSAIRPVWIQAADGTIYFPRLIEFNDQTNEATFLLLDGLPNGTYQLHLAGGQGLADFADNPLVGNDDSGDHVVTFTINGPERGSAGNPLLWRFEDMQGTASLGTLFPIELQAGVILEREFPAGTQSSFVEAFSFSVLQGQNYLILPADVGLSETVRLTLLDAQGNVLDTPPQGGGNGISAVLAAGEYVLRVEGQVTGDPADLTYCLQLLLSGASDNAPPLTHGPAPKIRARLMNDRPTTSGSDRQPAPPALAGQDNGSSIVRVAIDNRDNAPPALAASALFPANAILSLVKGPVGGAAVTGEPEPAAPSLVLVSPDLEQSLALNNEFAVGGDTTDGEERIDATSAAINLLSGEGMGSTLNGAGGLPTNFLEGTMGIVPAVSTQRETSTTEIRDTAQVTEIPRTSAPTPSVESSSSAEDEQPAETEEQWGWRSTITIISIVFISYMGMTRLRRWKYWQKTCETPAHDRSRQ